MYHTKVNLFKDDKVI